MNAWRDYFSHEMDISKELDADINFPKIHLISHWAEQIRRYGAFISKNISVQAEWLRQSGHGPSEPSETPRWRITPRPASIPRVALHIALRWQYRSFFSLCRSPISNEHSGVVGNCDHTSEWVHGVHACIGIAMQ